MLVHEFNKTVAVNGYSAATYRLALWVSFGNVKENSRNADTCVCVWFPSIMCSINLKQYLRK